MIELQSLSNQYHTDGQKHAANTITDRMFANMLALFLAFIYAS